MREISFRGKRLDTGEWKCGDLFHFRDGTVRINPHEIGQPWLGWNVDPSTVGQYTGLKDKNGKRIFEGDVLASRYDDLYPDVVTIELVEWAYNSWCIRQAGFHAEPLECDGGLQHSEVIGNIHDNPELLKGGE